MSHDFKTYKEQIQILKNRHLYIDDEDFAIDFLQKNNYYNVINGYKDLFIEDKENPSDDDVYIEGSKFKEICSLYLFDRELRITTLNYIIIFENTLKSIFSYHFSKIYRDKYAYLDIENFNPQKKKDTMEQFSRITKEISNKISKSAPIKHYIEKEKEIPLWVLVNYLTLGNISHLYDVLKIEEQNTICNYFLDNFANEYNRDRDELNAIDSIDFKNIIKITNLMRNICAHDERLYNSKLKRIDLRKIYNLFHINYINLKNYYSLLVCLHFVLPKMEFQKLLDDIKKLYSTYEGKFKTFTISKLKSVSGIEEGNLFNL